QRVFLGKRSKRQQSIERARRLSVQQEANHGPGRYGSCFDVSDNSLQATAYLQLEWTFEGQANRRQGARANLCKLFRRLFAFHEYFAAELLNESLDFLAVRRRHVSCQPVA